MVTPAFDQTSPRLHPLRSNWTARAWWAAGQALNWAAAAVGLWVLWVIPQGGLAAISNTVVWWSCAAAVGALALGRLSRGAQWQAWAEVPGAHALYSRWSRPRFEFTRAPDLLAVVLRFVAISAVGVVIAGQSSDHAYLIGVAGALTAFMAAFHTAQEVASRKMARESVNWITVAREGIGLTPGLAWCIAGAPAGISLGSTLWVLFIAMYVIGKIAVHLMRSTSGTPSVVHG